MDRRLSELLISTSFFLSFFRAPRFFPWMDGIDSFARKVGQSWLVNLSTIYENDKKFSWIIL